MRALAAVVVAVVVATGCGRASKPTVQPSPPPPKSAGPLADCPSGGWQALPTSGDDQPPAARLGSGRFGIVFANDSNNVTCDWSSEARALAAQEYAVAVFESIGSEALEVKAVAAALRRGGVRRVALIGASVGARAVLQVGAGRPGWLAGVVALSAERRIGSNPADLLPVGRRIRVPVLSVGSRQDPYTSFGKDTPAWDRAIPDDRALMLSGSGHGVEFLSGRHGPRVRAAILAFLRSLEKENE